MSVVQVRGLTVAVDQGQVYIFDVASSSVDLGTGAPLRARELYAALDQAGLVGVGTGHLQVEEADVEVQVGGLVVRQVQGYGADGAVDGHRAIGVEVDELGAVAALAPDLDLGRGAG